MTKQELESYVGIKAECEAIQIEIEMLYETVQALDYTKSVQASVGNVSNPTEKQAMRIMNLKEKLLKKRQEQIEMLEKIDEFVDSIENGEIRAIMRYHYLLGNSWTATSFKVFGVYSYDIPRKRIDRFFEGQSTEMSDNV